MKGINWLGVVVALVVGQALGFVWYGVVFQEQWMALSGITPTEDAANTAMAYGVVNQLVTAIGLGWAIAATGNTSFMGGAKVGLFAAVFFALTTEAQRFIYGGADTGLIPIDGGYLLVAYVLMGAVAGGVKMPAKAAAAA